MIRTRIAPSPTGYLHVGTARTALFNYLFAKKNKGKFILRVEDTDKERSKPEYEKDILEGLWWLGIKWDEGPIVPALNQAGAKKYFIKYKGRYGPYRQSERTDLYKHYIQKLLEEGKAFYCFHSKEELAQERDYLLKNKLPPIHQCEFRAVSLQQSKKLKKEKKGYIIRLKVPKNKEVIFRDLVRGEVKFLSDLLGDFSIARDIDKPLYNLAVVIDDYKMRISHVIRGEDHISNTPKQILIAEALGFKLPYYAHLPMLLGQGRAKLSKRHGAKAISEYQKEGYLPEALFNFLALLGWNPGDDRELFSPKELIKEFSFEHVQKSGAIFDPQKLDWMNGIYIRKKSADKLVSLCLPYLQKSGLLKSLILSTKSKSYLKKIIILEKTRIKKLSEISDRTDYFFKKPEYKKELLRWKDMSDNEILDALKDAEKILSKINKPFTRKKIEQAFLKFINDGDKGRILWPLRVALTGKRASPGPFEIMEILGKKEALARISLAKNMLQ